MRLPSFLGRTPKHSGFPREEKNHSALMRCGVRFANPYMQSGHPEEGPPCGLPASRATAGRLDAPYISTETAERSQCPNSTNALRIESDGTRIKPESGLSNSPIRTIPPETANEQSDNAMEGGGICGREQPKAGEHNRKPKDQQNQKRKGNTVPGRHLSFVIPSSFDLRHFLLIPPFNTLTLCRFDAPC